MYLECVVWPEWYISLVNMTQIWLILQLITMSRNYWAPLPHFLGIHPNMQWRMWARHILIFQMSPSDFVRPVHALKCHTCVASNENDCNRQGSTSCPQYADACSTITGPSKWSTPSAAWLHLGCKVALTWGMLHSYMSDRKLWHESVHDKSSS